MSGYAALTQPTYFLHFATRRILLAWPEASPYPRGFPGTHFSFAEPLECAMHSVHLIRHPATPFSGANQIGAQISDFPTEALEIQYFLSGDVNNLRIPVDAAPRRAENLWQHTCFEAFVAAPRGTGYFEFNFAPSGEWAMYQFDAYREGMKAIETPPPIITTRRTAHDLDVTVVVDLHGFPNFMAHAELRLALSAVVENSNGELSYWALAHPPGKPDFHHADSFTLALDQCKGFT